MEFLSTSIEKIAEEQDIEVSWMYSGATRGRILLSHFFVFYRFSVSIFLQLITVKSLTGVCIGHQINTSVTRNNLSHRNFVAENLDYSIWVEYSVVWKISEPKAWF